jgi:hypothetical protein
MPPLDFLLMPLQRIVMRLFELTQLNFVLLSEQFLLVGEALSGKQHFFRMALSNLMHLVSSELFQLVEVLVILMFLGVDLGLELGADGLEVCFGLGSGALQDLLKLVGLDSLLIQLDC